MAYQPVDIGTVANDGTGDPIRDAFDKVNDNFVELYAGLVGLLDFKGSTDCSANPNYPAASKGDYYLVSVAGKIGGASGIVVSAGDSYFALADNAGGTQASVGTSWTVIEGNLGFTPVNKAGDTMTGDLIVPDEAYDATAWNGSLEVPTKNAVRDKIEALAGGSFTAASTTEVLTGTDSSKGGTPDSIAALWEQGADVASAGTTSLGEGGYFNITGTTTITDIDFATDKAGRKVWVKFAGILTLTHNASTLILPTGANITTAAGDTACFVSEGSDVVRCVAYSRASGAALSGSGGGSGNLIGQQIITATGAGTYTPTAGTASVVIELQGGGGGGAGLAASTGSNVGLGRGGGGGGYIRTRLTSAFSGASYSVGAGGGGGAAGANNGTAGGDTTFTATGGGGTVYTAGGGPGGATAAAAAAPIMNTHTAGGTATNGDTQIPGGQGTCPFGVSAFNAIGGTGGASVLGRGGSPGSGGGSNLSVAGGNATGKGGGGGGAMNTGTGASKAGGNGSDGVIIFWEYGS